MVANIQDRELRVFLSSTFRDLQPEREELVKKTFPRIRKECRDRGVEFTEIDLRWGITEEESRSGRTIRICLEEIDRCRPYFIGILGSRYGWVPGMMEIEKDSELLNEFPWLAEYGSEEKSIIEMEFAHGAIQNRNDSAFFYEQQLETREDGLSPLSKKITAAGLPLRHFSSPEKLGEQVFSDIVTILDRDFPKRELTPLERERIEHEAYARNRLQSYVANPEYYEAFEKHVNSEQAPLIIWGKSGLGKSALMAHLAHEYHARHPEAFIVQHFIGAAEGSDPEDVMRQVMMEIKERYALADVIPTDDNALREEFPVWLAKVGQNHLLKKEGAGGGFSNDGGSPPNPLLLKEGEPLILLIDALNQLTGIAPEMHWLPEFIPPNVRLVVSTTAESQPLQELRKRNWNELELHPLTEIQRETIASDFLKRYRKSLTKADLHTLASSEKSSSPLFLRTVLEELRIFGSHTALRSHLSDYLESADERELFQKVLERMERDHGEENVRSVMTAIWASRHGLSESELMEITGFTRMTLSILMTALEYHLMKREEFHTFFHNYLREAIELRYLTSPSYVGQPPPGPRLEKAGEIKNPLLFKEGEGGGDPRQAAHAKLGEYFSTREFGPRRLDEEPWQWEAAGERERLITSLSDDRMLILFWKATKVYDFVHMASGANAAAQLLDHFGERLLSVPSSDISSDMLEAVHEFATVSGQYAEASKLFKALLEKHEVENPAELLLLRRQIAALEYHNSNFVVCIEQCKAILELPDLTPRETLDIYTTLSSSYYWRGQFEEALTIGRKALDLAENALESDLDIANCEKNIGAILFGTGDLENSIKSYERAASLYSRQLGANHPETIAILLNLAVSTFSSGRINEAFEISSKAVEGRRATFGRHHLSYIRALKSHGIRYINSGKFELGEKALEEALELSIESLGAKSFDTAGAGMAIASAKYVQNQFADALRLYREYFPLFHSFLGDDNPEVQKHGKRLEELETMFADGAKL